MADYRYARRKIERGWEGVWADERTWEVDNPDPASAARADDREKSYVLVMLPYPSGEPHIGHLKVYSGGGAPPPPAPRPPRAAAHGLRRVRPPDREPRHLHGPAPPRLDERRDPRVP